MSTSSDTRLIQNLGLLVVSFREDFILLQRLLESCKIYNKESLPIYVVVPEEDLEFMAEGLAVDPCVSILPQKLIPTQFAQRDFDGLRRGYLNQSITKLAFHRLGLLRNYVCVDSDAVFVRPFGTRDFLDRNGIAYSNFVEDNELQSDPVYYDRHWQGRSRTLHYLWEHLGGKAGTLGLTNHGHITLRCEVLEQMEAHLLSGERRRDFIDLLRDCPYEFSWYAYFLQLHFFDWSIREPLFKTLHTAEEFVRYSLFGWRNSDWARGYLGVVVNSNFQRGRGGDNPLSFETPTWKVQGIYLSPSYNFRIAIQSVLGFLASLVWYVAKFLKRKLRSLLAFLGSI